MLCSFASTDDPNENFTLFGSSHISTDARQKIPFLLLHSPKGISTPFSLLRPRIRLPTPIRQRLQIPLRQNLLARHKRIVLVIIVKPLPLQNLLQIIVSLLLPAAVLVARDVAKGAEFFLLDDDFLEAAFAVCFLEQGLLDRALGGETVDDDGAGLTDAVGAVLGLEILLRVPVAVEEDDGVGRGEVDAQPACPCAEEEKFVILAFVEGVDLLIAIFGFDAAVDAADVPAAQRGGPFFEEIELPAELAEENYFVAFLEEVGDQSVEHEHFSGLSDESGVWVLIGGPGVEEVMGGIAGKTELHDGVLEGFPGDFTAGELEMFFGVG